VIRAAAGTVLGGIAFLALLEVAHPAEMWIRRRLRARREHPPPEPRWTEGRAGF
jgi:hypothetical protein